MSVSEFKATCLAVLERVRVSGRPVLVTRRGVPLAEVVPPSTVSLGGRSLGGLAATGRVVGDIVGPIFDESEIEALR